MRKYTPASYNSAELSQGGLNRRDLTRPDNNNKQAEEQTEKHATCFISVNIAFSATARWQTHIHAHNYTQNIATSVEEKDKYRHRNFA